MTNFLARRKPAVGTPEFGKSFEHYILMELLAYKAYRSAELEISFWRTSNKQEVDFILDDMQVAIEVKATARAHEGDLRGFGILAEEAKIGKRLLVSLDTSARRVSDRAGAIDILPWRSFLEQLWNGDIVR